MKKFDAILDNFALEARPLNVSHLGDGLINDTYMVETDRPDLRYVLQRINHCVFQDVDGLQRNIDAVTRHLRGKMADFSDPDRHVLRFIPCRATGRSYCRVGADYWRVSVYIPGTVTIKEVTAETAASAGRAFGRFEAMLTDLREPLIETIPDFHNMELRLHQLRVAVASDPVSRVDSVRPIVEAIEARASEMTVAERLGREGKLPRRLCHCDTKVNNMLIDAVTGEVLCVIDLDTVMPSFVFSDYGDFLRTGACTAAEDEPDLSKIDFDMDIYHAFTDGYLSEAESFLTPLERSMLPFAVRLFPYMQATRFLTDYINGDTYYKTIGPEHNLVRTRAQLALLDAIDRRLP